MIQYYLTTAILSIASLSAQECGNPLLDYEDYAGHVVIQDGKAQLEGDKTVDGISFLVSCDGDTLDEHSVTITLEPAFINKYFTVKSHQKIVGKKMLVLADPDNYDLVSSVDIVFTMKVCSGSQAVQCTSATVTVSYPFNTHAPEFTTLFGSATLDAKACEDNPDSMEACEIKFDPYFAATDADGDALEYSIVPITEHSILFKLADTPSLAIYYVGRGIPENMNITIMIQAKEKRIPTDVRSSRAVVEIIATKPTEKPEVSDCNDKNEDLYFIMTIVFASLIGVILILLISILIYRKFYRD